VKRIDYLKDLDTDGRIILKWILNNYGNVTWVHCHKRMARRRVADRGDGLQIWRVAANILNKKSRTADSGWSCSFGVGRGLTTPHSKTQWFLRNTTHSLRTRRSVFTHEREEKSVPGFGGKARRKDYPEDQGVDGRMGSEWILRRLAGGVDWLSIGTSGELIWMQW
jgi:hypothetical protein